MERVWEFLMVFQFLACGSAWPKQAHYTSGYPPWPPIRWNNFSLRFHLIGGFSYGLPGPGQSWVGHSWTREIVPMGHMGHGQSVLVGHIFAWPIICLSQVVPVLSHSVWGLKLKIWSRIQSNLSSSWWYIHIFYCQNHQNFFLDKYRHLRLVG